MGWEDKVLDQSNSEHMRELGACLFCVMNLLDWDMLVREVVRGGGQGRWSGGWQETELRRKESMFLGFTLGGILF